LFLGRLSPPVKTIAWLGQNTLILMCLNGLFYHYVNPGAAKWLLNHFSGSVLTVTAAGVGVTLASLSACIPLVYVLTRFFPQLVGKPQASGPLLKNFVIPEPLEWDQTGTMLKKTKPL
jgi:acyltransferase